MNLKKLVFPRGTIKEGDQGDKVVPFFKTVLQYLNVPYTDTCCEESFNPFPSGYNVVNATYAEAGTLISTNSLAIGSIYYISNRDIYLTAVSGSSFSQSGAKIMYCPSDYVIHTDAYGNVWKGVWRSTGSYSVNDLAIWGNQVWKNTTGVAGTATNAATLNGANWVLIPKTSFTNHEYTQLVFSIIYDLASDWVSKQFDSKSNVIGCSKTQWATISAVSNPSDITDWNNPYIRDNNVWAIFNNSYVSTSGYADIKYNSNIGGIYNNIVTSGTFGITGIFENTNGGSIYNNTKPSIRGNSNNLQIQGNSGDYIIYNSNLNAITFNSASVISYNSNNGNITSNSTGNITINSNNGEISQNSNTGTISFNSNNGDIGNASGNRNLGSINYNSNNGNIQGFTNSASSYSILNNTFNGTMNGAGSTLTANVDGHAVKSISTNTYTLLPWDWNNVYTFAGNTTITVPTSIPIPHSSSHVALGAGYLIISPAGGVTINNYNGDTKSNGQYAPIALTNTSVNNFILGGNTQP